MPDQRIQEILAEISAIAINPRIRALIVELGTILAELAVNEKMNKADADDRFKTVGVIYRRLLKDLRRFEVKLEEREHNVAAKIHQFSNRIMAFEMQLAEIMDAIQLTNNDDITRAKIFGDDREGIDDAITSDDIQSP
jgi:hypothetical protein